MEEECLDVGREADVRVCVALDALGISETLRTSLANYGLVSCEDIQGADEDLLSELLHSSFLANELRKRLRHETSSADVSVSLELSGKKSVANTAGRDQYNIYQGIDEETRARYEQLEAKVTAAESHSQSHINRHRIPFGGELDHAVVETWERGGTSALPFSKVLEIFNGYESPVARRFIDEFQCLSYLDFDVRSSADQERDGAVSWRILRFYRDVFFWAQPLDWWRPHSVNQSVVREWMERADRDETSRNRIAKCIRRRCENPIMVPVVVEELWERCNQCSRWFDMLFYCKACVDGDTLYRCCFACANDFEDDSFLSGNPDTEKAEIVFNVADNFLSILRRNISYGFIMLEVPNTQLLFVCLALIILLFFFTALATIYFVEPSHEIFVQDLTYAVLVLGALVSLIVWGFGGMYWFFLRFQTLVYSIDEALLRKKPPLVRVYKYERIVLFLVLILIFVGVSVFFSFVWFPLVQGSDYPCNATSIIVVELLAYCREPPFTTCWPLLVYNSTFVSLAPESWSVSYEKTAIIAWLNDNFRVGQELYLTNKVNPVELYELREIEFWLAHTKRDEWPFFFSESEHYQSCHGVSIGLAFFLPALILAVSVTVLLLFSNRRASNSFKLGLKGLPITELGKMDSGDEDCPLIME